MGKDLNKFLKTIKKGGLASWEAIQSFLEKKPRYLSILNGLIGDTLDAYHSPLAIEMSLLGKARGGKLCILVHGLFDTEETWQFPDDPTRSYGSLFQKDLGYTPLYLRYNSGLHISTNGQLLARLLTETCGKGSKSIREIIFICHSLGGLVVRSACHYGQKEGAPWVNLVKKIFFLGTPHLGTDLEKIGHLTSVILRTIPNLFTKGIAALGNKRSAAIKDLRYGYLLDEDWRERDADTFSKDNRHHVPLLEGVDYYIIAAVLAKKSNNIFAEYFGDGFVPSRSAAGRSFLKSKSIPFPPNHFKLVKGLSHMELAHHREVYKKIKKWCG